MCISYAKNISVIIGSMMAASTTTLQQFNSAPVIYCNWFCNIVLPSCYETVSLNSCEWLAVALYYNHIWLFYLSNKEAIECSVVFWINCLYTFSLYLFYIRTATSTHSRLQKILLILLVWPYSSQSIFSCLKLLVQR